MEIINHFEKKGGRIVWSEDFGIFSTYKGKTKEFLINQETREVFRASHDEYRNPPDGFVRAKGFYA